MTAKFRRAIFVSVLLEKQVLKLPFRPGFPEQHHGLDVAYVFEVELEDNTTREAFVGYPAKSPDYCWFDAKTKEIIPTEKVKGWRETYNCDAARQDIDIYFCNPLSIVGKNYLGDAFRRHISRENCQECRRYYEAKGGYRTAPNMQRFNEEDKGFLKNSGIDPS